MISICVVDPQGDDALRLLRYAAVEARALYPELHVVDAPWPTNPPTPPGGTYLVAYEADVPIGCGALRPIDSATVEVRRMFVMPQARRRGVGLQILAALEVAAQGMGYVVMRLETGDRQRAAMMLYENFGFGNIAPFGVYTDDPSSVCFEKRIGWPDS